MNGSKASAPRGLAVAVTGGMGCGKTEVGRILAGEGAVVVDADSLVHGMLSSAHKVGRAVIDLFGKGVVREDGSVDRRAVAAKVFDDPSSLAALNGIVHPAVKDELRKWVAETTAAGRDAVALVPLLYEAGAADGWDAVICVSASEAAVIERLRRRGWAEHDVRRRMKAQMPLEEKEKRADFVIRNDAGLGELEMETMRVWKDLARRRSSDDA